MGNKADAAPMDWLTKEEVEKTYPSSDKPICEDEFKVPLDPNLDYYDATNLEKAILAKLKEQQVLVDAMAKTMIDMQKSMIRAHRKLIELEADMGAAGIGPKADKKSALILPDRMN